MTIASYAELQTTIGTLSHRTDLATIMPTLIGLAEDEIFRELSLRGFGDSVSGTTSGDTIALPAGIDVIVRIELQADGYEYTLNYTPAGNNVSLTGSTDRPTRFYIEDGVINLLAAPSGPYTYVIHYLPNLTALSDSNTTNWLLTNHSDVYVKAGLKQVALYTKDQMDIDRYTNEQNVALDSVKRSDERKRFPVSGGLQIKPRGFR